MGSKIIIGFGLGIVLFIMTIGTLVIFEANAENNQPEIDQNQVEDKISRTIYVQLQDGLNTSDGIR